MKKFFGFCLLTMLNFIFAISNNPVTNFNAQRYLGSWYEVARLNYVFEYLCSPPIIADYSLDVNTKNVIIKNTCNFIKDNTVSVSGIGVFSEGDTVGLLNITFAPEWARDLNFLYADYRVLDTDYDSYALVGSASKKYLWILSRNRTLDTTKLQELVNEASQIGYDTDKLLYMN